MFFLILFHAPPSHLKIPLILLQAGASSICFIILLLLRVLSRVYFWWSGAPGWMLPVFFFRLGVELVKNLGKSLNSTTCILNCFEKPLYFPILCARKKVQNVGCTKNFDSKSVEFARRPSEYAPVFVCQPLGVLITLPPTPWPIPYIWNVCPILFLFVVFLFWFHPPASQVLHAEKLDSFHRCLKVHLLSLLAMIKCSIMFTSRRKAMIKCCLLDTSPSPRD